MIQLEKIIKDSMKSSNLLKTKLFRRVKAKAINIQIANGKKDSVIKESDIMIAMKREYKEIQEELEFTMKALQSAKSKALCAQLSYLDVYLPRDIPKMETELLVMEAIKKVGFNVGMVMKELKTSGKNINMRMASEITKNKCKDKK